MTESGTTRSYTQKTLKLLWGRAAGRCAVPMCRVELYADKTEHDPAVPLGDIAHVHSHADSGPRADASLSSERRNGYGNLILLCKNCHARLDGQKNTNTVEVILRLKQDHEAWVRASLPERGRSRTGWLTFVIEDQWPIDSLTFDAALSPDYIIEAPKRLDVSLDERAWPEVALGLRAELETAMNKGDLFDKRIAVFPLARITACLYAGYILTNRPNVQLFQYHRDDRTWEWPAGAKPGTMPEASAKGSINPKHVFFSFELSAKVDLEPLLHGLPAVRVARVGIESPSTSWLQRPEQLRRLGTVAREVFENALACSSPSTIWHIVYAGPAPGAVVVGQQLNPTMTPKVQLYEYIHPSHVLSLVIDPRAAWPVSNNRN